MAPPISRRRLGVLAAAASVPAPGALAGLRPPAGRAILTVSGAITVLNGEGVARFDRDMLEALGMKAIQTTTPWFDGAVRFEGVPMARLMREVGAAAAARTVTAYALNDYTTDIPVSDFERFGVVLALKRNGAYMPVRDKGPLFIVYPYDEWAELRSQLYYSRSAWQVAKLAVA